MTQTYLTRRQVAELYSISEHTLARLASQRRGPLYFKPFDKVLYRPQDIEQWIESAPVAPSNDIAKLPSERTGRGRSSRPARTASAAPKVRETVSANHGRRLKSLTPSPNSWLLRGE